MDNIDEFISNQIDYAQRTARLLGLYQSPPKDILEIGCGLGHLSIVLRQLGHNVVSCDNKEWLHDYESSNPTSIYLQACKKVNHNFNHFYFEIPNQKYKELNYQMFETLKSYHPSGYHFILWQNSCFWQKHNNVNLNDTKTLINSLKSLLIKNGKLIFGYRQKNHLEMDPDFESSESYQWLSQYRTKMYQDKMGYYTYILEA